MHPFLNGLFTSLEQYFETKEYPSKALMEVKMKKLYLRYSNANHLSTTFSSRLTINNICNQETLICEK